jgi:hypothetical protein
MTTRRRPSANTAFLRAPPAPDLASLMLDGRDDAIVDA